MIILGITGSIATGKSFVANCFINLGYKLFDSDKVVRHLLSNDKNLTKQILQEFPSVSVNEDVNKIDRKKLSQIVFNDKIALKKLESIIHPVVAKKRDEFLKESLNNNELLVILDIPLLYENNLDKICDYVIVTYVNEAVQLQRVLAREGMSEEIFRKIQKNQLPDSIKKHQADFIIDTNVPEREIIDKIKSIIETIKNKEK